MTLTFGSMVDRRQVKQKSHLSICTPPFASEVSLLHLSFPVYVSTYWIMEFMTCEVGPAGTLNIYRDAA